MQNYKRIVYILLLAVSLNATVLTYKSHAEVVNFILANLSQANGKQENNHIITLRDVKIEYEIQKKLANNNKGRKIGEDLLWEIIDDYILLTEMVRKNPQWEKEINEELKVKIDIAIKDFEALFENNEYSKFLADLEIDKDYIYLRFKNKLLINIFLEKELSNLKQALSSKNDSVTDEKIMLNYIMTLREKTYIIINHQYEKQRNR